MGRTRWSPSNLRPSLAYTIYMILNIRPRDFTHGQLSYIYDSGYLRLPGPDLPYIHYDYFCPPGVITNQTHSDSEHDYTEPEGVQDYCRMHMKFV